MSSSDAQKSEVHATTDDAVSSPVSDGRRIPPSPEGMQERGKILQRVGEDDAAPEAGVRPTPGTDDSDFGGPVKLDAAGPGN